MLVFQVLRLGNKSKHVAVFMVCPVHPWYVGTMIPLLSNGILQYNDAVGIWLPLTVSLGQDIANKQ